jgi:colanic acid biosynthesis glycosyl transferase WcaI
MRILFLSDFFPPETTAAAFRVYERARYWASWGHTVTVVTAHPNYHEGAVYAGYVNRWRSIEEIAGIRVVRVKTFIATKPTALLRTFDYMSYMITAFCAGLLEKPPDLVVSTSPQFFAAIAGCALATAKGVPFVFELSDLWPASIVAVGAMKQTLAIRCLEALELYLYKRAAAIVALTNAFKTNLVHRGVPARKVSVVVNGVDLATTVPRNRDADLGKELGLDPDHFVLGYMGNHGTAQALNNVLEAARLLSGSNIRFLLVGNGVAREQLIAEARAKRLDNVIFAPAQPKDVLARYWSLCQAALVSLRNDPVFETVLPSKMFEAMGMGLPLLITAPQGEASQLIVSHNAGLWVRPEDPEALARAVLLLRDDPCLRDRLASNSLASAQQFSRARQAEAMIAVFQQVLGRAFTHQ